ncbi:hypothetical protein U27_05378 [Candidatus Vecturithrix granuli]|uniref:Uncharacterized protein n=1 Tax=Vecturithrix granuli TaxID=1499967 RepID=A0A081C1E9_VECG1|nr:hypothetical protein U27_05378 [Candidatus Vecturithrix granuli]
MKKFLDILKIIGVVLLLAVLSFAGFKIYQYFNRVAPEQEGKFSFASGTMPVDKNFYVISGEITGAPTGIIRQERAQKGTFLALGDLMYGTLAGDKTGGKVILRFKLTNYSGDPGISAAAKELFDYAVSHPGTEFFAKFVDTKANMVMPGDRFEAVCRLQAEAVGAVSDSDALRPVGITYELDLCKLRTARVQVVE